MARKFTTNSRLVNEIFASYANTFLALCELINNSIQAGAKNIHIDIDYDDDVFASHIINKLSVKDDGCGVHIDELDYKLLDIGTTNKVGGKGVGRFAAFQLGKTVLIETVGFSNTKKQFSEAIIPLNVSVFENNINVSEVSIDTQERILSGHNHSTFYKVSITDFYESYVYDAEKRKKISEKLLKENIVDAIFERYSLKIFAGDINFYINSNRINPRDYIIGYPSLKTETYEDNDGRLHQIQFRYYNIRNIESRRVFLTTNNAGIETIAYGFEYDAEWLSPKIGGWFIYISSPTLISDLNRSLCMDDMDPEVRHFRSFIRQSLTTFFRTKNVEFDNFLDKLQKDSSYPYKSKSSSKSKVVLFNKLAFLVEDKYNLLNEDNKLREIIYPLIDRTISNGELDNILSNILRLSSKTITQFNSLLNKTDLEDIIYFSDKVANKREELEFIEKLVYSEISEHVKERKELHKFLERMLWIFGEEFNDSTKLLSDKGLENNLKNLRDNILKYSASRKDDNINQNIPKGTKSITDLFMYSERILDCEHREVLVVELKAPKVKISAKELAQVKKYAREIENSGFTPQNVNFKILLVSSDISETAKYEIKGDNSNPFVYFKSQSLRVEIWVMKWSDVIERQKRKLNYLSANLNIKDVDVEAMAKKDFKDIHFQNSHSTLKTVSV